MTSPETGVGAGGARRVLVSTALSAALAVVAVLGQSTQRPVFRGTAVLVNVDVYPTRDGRLVEGLAPEDFQVLEDGAPQRVENFEFVHIDTSPADGARRDPNTKEEGETLAADPRHRVFVFYFDIYHLNVEGARNMRAAFREFVERTAGPTDYLAAMTPDLTVRDLVFFQRLETLEAAVDRMWRGVFDRSTSVGGQIQPQSPQEEFIYSCFINRPGGADIVASLITRWRLDQVMTGLRDITAKLASIRDERATVFLFSGGWTFPGPSTSLSANAWGSQATGRRGLPPGMPGPRTLSSAPRNSGACDAELFRLASIDYQESFRGILDVASRANVAITTIDPAGLSIYDISMSDPSPRRGNPQDRLDPLRVLASNTNGTAIVSTNDLRTPLRRIADEVSSYYLLGYYSTNTKFDGKYRKIQVKAKAPGTKIVARRGYVAMNEASLNSSSSAKAAPAPAEATPVDDALATLARLRSQETMGAEAAGGSNSGTGEVVVGTTTAGPLLGGASIFRATPAPRSPLAPVVDRLFRRTERVHVEWAVSQPLDDRVGRVLDRKGQPLPFGVTLTEREADGKTVLSADLNLASFAPGDYVIELVAKHGAESERRLIAIRVEY